MDKYHPKTENLVHWKGASLEDATWENLWRFSKTYSKFGLEDKALLGGGWIDMILQWLVMIGSCTC
jgi:hypothetical protein